MGTKISDLPVTGVLPADAVFPLEYGGANYSVKASDLGAGGSGGSNIAASLKCDEDGVLTGPAHNASIARTAEGKYTVTFNTPLPDANYRVMVGIGGPGTIGINDSAECKPTTWEHTTTGFDIWTGRASIIFHDSPLSVVVFNSNTGGSSSSGPRAYVAFDGNGNITTSFNVDSVTDPGNIFTTVNFTTAIPNPVPIASHRQGTPAYPLGISFSAVSSSQITVHTGTSMDNFSSWTGAMFPVAEIYLVVF